MSEYKKCTYFLKKEEKQCGKVFKSHGSSNRYCPSCNAVINKSNECNYIKYSKYKYKGGGGHGKGEFC